MRDARFKDILQELEKAIETNKDAAHEASKVRKGLYLCEDNIEDHAHRCCAKVYGVEEQLEYLKDIIEAYQMEEEHGQADA